MAPDVNSLPPSRSISSSPNQNRAFPPAPGSESQPRNTPSPRPSVSLAAAATLNAADRTTTNEQVSPAVRRASARRRSNVAMNLQLNDPTLPSPGELASNSHRSSISSAFRTASPTNIGGTPAIATGDPHHQRAPSLGEIHQELEQEQEAQVNRLLQMIRIQQSQLQQLQSQQGQSHTSPTSQAQGSSATGQASSQSMSTAIDDSTPTSERSFSLPVTTSVVSSQPTPTSSLPHRSSIAGRRLSQSPSPALRPLPRPPSFLHQSHTDSSALSSSTSDIPSPSEPFGTSASGTRRTSRDEVAFYQAETANVTRENQMLRHRIKELEKLLVEKESKESDATSPLAPIASTTADGNPPAVPTHLSREVTADDSEGQSTGPCAG